MKNNYAVVKTKSNGNEYVEIYQDTVTPFEAGIYKPLHAGYGKLQYRCVNSPNEKIVDIGGVGDTLIKDVRHFFSMKEAFKNSSLPHKRGYLLHGAPGCGKSCAIRLITKEFVEKLNGIVLIWSIDAGRMDDFYRQLRMVEPERPIMLVAEDIDATLVYFETQLVEFLDGHDALENVVLIATTNYLAKIPDRLKKRPSRIDQVIEVGKPTLDERKLYLRNFNLEKAKADTLAALSEGLTFAQVKELFVATQLLGKDARETLKLLGSTILDNPEELNQLKSEKETLDAMDGEA